MDERVWVAVVNKITFYCNGIKKINIKVANYQYMVRFDDKISLNFIVNLEIFDLSGGLYTPIIIKVQLFEKKIFTSLIS